MTHRSELGPSPHRSLGQGLGLGLTAAAGLGAVLALAALAARSAPRSPQPGLLVGAAPMTTTLTSTPTGTLTLVPTAAPRPSEASTAAVTASAVMTEATPTTTASITATASPTGTHGPAATRAATVALTSTVTATAEPTVPATAAPSRSHMPYAGNRDAPAASVPQRIWGAQLAGDDVAAVHAANALVELPRMRAQGIRSIRTHVHWAELEPQDVAPDGYAFAATDRRLADYGAAGFDVVASIVDYPAWATTYRCGFALHAGQEAAWREFVGAVAARYARPPFSVVAWEIGNEVDGATTVDASDWARPPEWGRGEPTVPHGGCWGDRPEAYVDFLRAAAEAIDASAPRAWVTLGNLALVDLPDSGFHADFLERFLAAGGGQLVDYVGFHWFPDLADYFPDAGLPDGPAKVRQVADALARHGARKPIWLTETYRLTREGDAASELRQLEFITKGLVDLAARTPLERIYWYGWRDFAGVAPGTTQRGLVRPDHGPKAALAAAALRAMIEATDGVATDVSTPDVVAFRFRPVRGGAVRYAAWSRSGAPATLRLPPPPVRGTVAHTVRFVADGEGEVAAPRATFVAGVDGLVIPLGAETTFVLLRSP